MKTTTRKARKKNGAKPKVNGATGRRKPGRPRKPTVDAEGVLTLGPHLDRFVAGHAKLEAAKAHFSVVQHKVELWLAKSNEYRALQAELLAARQALRIEGEAFNGTIKAISQEINYDLTACSIDNESGRVYVLDDAGRKKPAIPDTIAESTASTDGG